MIVDSNDAEVFFRIVDNDLMYKDIQDNLLGCKDGERVFMDGKKDIIVFENYCMSCEKNIKRSKFDKTFPQPRNMLPKESIRYFDWGKRNKTLPYLINLEKIVISKVIPCLNILKLRLTRHSILRQSAIFGHSICLPIQSDNLGEEHNAMLLKADIAKYCHIIFLGDQLEYNVMSWAMCVLIVDVCISVCWKEIMVCCLTHCFGTTIIHNQDNNTLMKINVHNCLQWLQYIKKIDNPYYRDVRIVGEKETMSKLKETEYEILNNPELAQTHISGNRETDDVGHCTSISTNG